MFVLKKGNLSDSKILRITLTGKQIAGRTINLKTKYGDIMKAHLF